MSMVNQPCAAYSQAVPTKHALHINCGPGIPTGATRRSSSRVAPKDFAVRL